MLLRFVAHTTFRYSVRSIAHLIDTIDRSAFRNQQLQIEDLGLPMTSEEKLQKSNLRLHFLDKDGSFGILDRWKEFSADRSFCPITSGPDSPFAFLHPRKER
jgi:ACT domain-containing protein